MNREDARKAAEVMLAYANGEEIECLVAVDNKYNIIENPNFNWFDSAKNYRIKPKSTYRPFKTKEECWTEMHKHQPFGWIIYNKKYYSVYDVTSNEITILYECDPCCFDFKSCMEELTFTDGTPFGIKEE